MSVDRSKNQAYDFIQCIMLRIKDKESVLELSQLCADELQQDNKKPRILQSCWQRLKVVILMDINRYNVIKANLANQWISIL